MFETSCIYGRRAHVLTLVEALSWARLVEAEHPPLKGERAAARCAHRARETDPAVRVRCVVALLLSALPVAMAMAQSDVPTASPTSAQGTPVSSEQASAPVGISTRPYLTGDWGGVRSALAEHGMTLDLRHTGSYQGLVSGTGDEEFNYGGKLSEHIRQLRQRQAGPVGGGRPARAPRIPLR